jgi:iron complex transport system ATP-binding protein
MKDGRIFRDGPKEDILTSPYLSELFRMELDVMKRDGYYAVV